MFECTLIRKSFQSPLPDVPKKKTNKDDDDDDKKDPDGFQKPENSQCHLWRRSKLLQTCPKATAMGDPFS